jgi:hypothetical protein
MKAKQVFVDDANKYHETERECRLADAVILLEGSIGDCTYQNGLSFNDFLDILRTRKELQDAILLIIEEVRSKKPKGQP